MGLTQAPTDYKSDKLWSYELGVKTRALQNSLVMTGALYDIRWNNIQTDIILPTCTFDIKDNIGSAESKGVEAQVDAHVNDHVALTLGGNYTSAKIVEPVTLLGVEKGDRVPGVPDYSINASAEYSQPLDFGGRGKVRLDGQWIGSSQGTIIHDDPDFNRPSYFVMGASGGVRWGNYRCVAVHHEFAQRGQGDSAARTWPASSMGFECGRGRMGSGGRIRFEAFAPEVTLSRADAVTQKILG